MYIGSLALATYQYATGNGLLQKQTYGNGDSVTYTYNYDPLGRMVSCRVKEGTVVILTIHWQYDDAGRVKVQEWQMGESSYRETYTYSETDGSLVSITHDGGSAPEFTYTYDSLQRMTGVSTDKYTHSYTYRDIENM